MQTFDNSKVQAYVLYDASVVFLDPVKSAIRTPYKKRATSKLMVLDGMSAAAHDGLVEVDAGSADHYWYIHSDGPEDQEAVGNLPNAIADTYRYLVEAIANKKVERIANLCGKMAHHAVDAYLGMNLVEHQDGFVVRGRISQDTAAHLMELPFLFDATRQGDHFQLESAFAHATSVMVDLEGFRQNSLNIINCYLSGNGWPAAAPGLRKAYNRACNELANAVLTATAEALR